MILLDIADRKVDIPVAGSTLRVPARAVGRFSSPLPPYDFSQAQHGLSTRTNSRGKPDSRVWRVTLYALVLYLILSAAIGVPYLVMRFAKGHRRHPLPWPPIDDGFSSLHAQNLASSGMSPSDLTGCNLWTEINDISSHSLYTATVYHDFHSSGSLFIRSNVSHEAVDAIGVSGNITVNINPDSTAVSIIMAVSIHASTPEIRRRTFACFVDEGTDRGLSLYVPQDLDEDSLHVDITMLLPQAPTSVSTFATYLPMFTHFLGDLSEFVTFERVTLEGASKDISCDFMQAPRINVKNALAAISGSFNASHHLVLDTVGGPVYGNITLAQVAGRISPTYFSLDTGNSDIHASLTMHVTAELEKPIRFIGSVKNFNGPIKLGVAHHPSTQFAPINLRVQNNQAVSNVIVDANVVGSFDLHTKLASASVKESSQAPLLDSHGQLVHHNCVYDSRTSNRVRGWVGWGERKHGEYRKESHIEVVSSLSPVSLQLGEGGL